MPATKRAPKKKASRAATAEVKLAAQPDHGVVFERAASTRGNRGALTSELMVEVGIKLADEDGLDAVTVRSIGRIVRIPPMRVIRIVGKKDDLLVLMIDAIYKELPLPKRGDWRAALRGIAKELRAVAKRHPWFVGPLSGRPHIGPHSFTYLEAALAALPFASIDEALDAYRAVASYTIGGILSEKSELSSATGRDEWQAASYAYVQRMLASGNFPTLKRVVDEAKHREGAFERGLEVLLDGLEASLARR